MKASSTQTVIPIHINLKELVRPETDKIDSKLIRDFVHHAMNRVIDRDIEEFLETEFEWGLKNGTWLFLFDSFDELPEVLSSIEADKSVRCYADAISEFLHGMNRCRGIVASRQFRGPGQLGWPKFKILALSETRRFESIRRTDLKTELASEIVGRLDSASDGLKTWSSNPMFLGLLCEYMRAGHAFPNNAHEVFETYVTVRLTRDTKRLQQRFNLSPDSVRAAAEAVAFCMAAESGLGLSPTRAAIDTALRHLELAAGIDLHSHLDALEFLKLARSESDSSEGKSSAFTFAHRRFQEYFATCVVLREPHRVTPHQLLTDARWRETAVVLCQTQPVRELSPILREAEAAP